MFENAPLLKSLIESLEPMISILSDEMAQRIGRIVLVIVRDNSQRLVSFKSESYVDIGIRLAMYASPEIEEDIILSQMDSPETKGRLEGEFFVGAVRLLVFGDPNQFSKSSREDKLNKCQNSADIEKFIESYTDLIDERFLEEWLQISEENGGYFRGGYVTTRPFDAFGAGMLNSINFGYDSDPKYRKGQLNLAEDIACVFGQILRSLYAVEYSENPQEAIETVINDLLNKTPGEIGLYKKYRIACESLINWYQDGLERQILTGFIQAINAAIKNAEENTNGQST